MDEAYQQPITPEDTGIIKRNQLLTERLSLFLLSNRMLVNGTFLDYGGGYGILTRMMRDQGFDYRWQDEYAPNLFAAGFQADLSRQYAAVSLFEVFEHLVDPAELVSRILCATNTLVLSTEVRPVNVIPEPSWRYFAFEHGQHISFASVKTLEHLARLVNARLYTDNRYLHVLSRNRVAAMGIKWRIAHRIAAKIILPLAARRHAKTIADSRSATERRLGGHNS